MLFVLNNRRGHDDFDFRWIDENDPRDLIDIDIQFADDGLSATIECFRHIDGSTRLHGFVVGDIYDAAGDGYLCELGELATLGQQGDGLLNFAVAYRIDGRQVERYSLGSDFAQLATGEDTINALLQSFATWVKSWPHDADELPGLLGRDAALRSL